MKKILVLLLSAIMVFSLTACGGKNTDSSKSGKKIKIGMVTDVGGVNDGSFNQSAWKVNGLKRSLV